MKCKEYFIGGIDTDCGKTFVTGHLAKQLMACGKSVITTKLVQTGCEGISEDILTHRRLMQSKLLPEDKNLKTCPYVFTFPASPHLSASLDNRSFSLKKVRKFFAQLSQKYDIVLTEGAGGLLVPITENYFITDYLAENSIPLILVSSSKLGSINHTLLSIEVCRTKKLKLHSIVYNTLPGSDKIIAEDTYSFLKNYIAKKFPQVTFLHSEELFCPQLSQNLRQYLAKF